MAQWNINDYVQNTDLALADAITDPGLQGFIAPTDMVLLPVAYGGVQAQVQTLSRAAIARVLSQYIAKLAQAGVDLKFWICDPGEFDLCAKLKNPISDVMRELEAFLNKRWVKAGIDITHVTAILAGLVSLHVVAASLAIVAVLGNLDGFFRDLCGCP